MWGGLATPFYGELKIGGGKQGRDFEVRTWDWGLFYGCVLADVDVIVLLFM